MQKQFFSSYNIFTKALVFQDITFELDIIISKSNNFTYSKFSNIVRRIMFVLCNEILIFKILNAFIQVFRIFLLFSN